MSFRSNSYKLQTHHTTTSNFRLDADRSRISAFWFDWWMFCIIRRIICRSGKGSRSRIGRGSLTSSEGISRFIATTFKQLRIRNGEVAKHFSSAEANPSKNNLNKNNPNRSRNQIVHHMNANVSLLAVICDEHGRANETAFFHALMFLYLFSLVMSSSWKHSKEHDINIQSNFDRCGKNN